MQQVGLHLWNAYENFFGKRSKFPHFKRKVNGWSLHFPQIKPEHITTNAVRIPGLGWVKAIVSFPLSDITGSDCTPKSLVVRFDGDLYTVSILVESPYIAKLPPAGEAVGIDRGIHVTASCSDGTELHAPVATPSERRRYAIRKRRISRKHKGSHRRTQAVTKARRTQRKIIRRIDDAIHKFTTHLAKTKPVIVVEDLHIRGMTASAAGSADQPGTNVRQKSGLNRSILEQGWGKIQSQLQYKCLRHGSSIFTVPAAHSSQTCAACDHVDAKSRRGLRFHCTACGHQDHADHNASVVIKMRWQRGLGTNITNVPVEGRNTPASLTPLRGWVLTDLAQARSTRRKYESGSKPIDSACELYHHGKTMMTQESWSFMTGSFNTGIMTNDQAPIRAETPLICALT